MKPSIPLPANGSSPFQGPGLSRRAFLELGASGLVMSWFLPTKALAFDTISANVVTKSTAKNVIFLFMTGAPSQTDTWDLKEGAWTPADFTPTDMGGGLRFPVGLLPTVANHLGDVAIVRSCLMWALVHGLAQTWTQIARNPTGATGAIAPHLGAISALELSAHRSASDVLPAFVALNTGTSMVGSGYLPSLYAPFSVQPSTSGLASLTHPDGTARFALRWNDLEAVDAALRSGAPLGKDASDVAGFYQQAKTLMDASDVNALFSFTTDESTRYGGTSFGNSCLVAKKVLAGRRGARFVQVTLNGWDHHSNIYGTTGNSIYSQSKQLDPALGSLLADLKSTPGETAGKTLLDETLVLVAGEFGRTVGGLNGQDGRDHFLRTSVVLAGGGVKGGRVLGATDATGANLTEAGWSANRDVRPEDLACTLYSALGIDWTTERHDDPLGRGFEYVPYAKDGTYKPIDELF
jgi:uncharacterized protein (DUF1501 family)